MSVPRTAGRRYDFLNLRSMLIGLSYHGGDDDYEDYVRALERRAGALDLDVSVIWLAGADRETRLDVCGRLDALVLTGGPDVEPHRYGHADPEGHCKTQPARDEVEFEVLERLRERPIPTLAICRGAQMLNVFHGGTLLTDLGAKNAVHRREGQARREHGIAIAPGSMLHRIASAGLGRTNSSHHQAVDRLAEAFRVSARSDDGVIEAFGPVDPGAQPFLLAVQWHPEGMAPGEPLADRVLDALLLA